MQCLRASAGIIEHERIRPGTAAQSSETRANEAQRPISFSREQRIAVLVVVPLEMARAELLLCLDASGYDVWTAPTGRAAVEMAEQTPLDIILLDLDGMYEISPDVMVSGFRVLHLLGRLTRERPVAVVVMTNMDFAEVEGPVRASADGFINKPVDPAQLIQRLRGALARARSRHRPRMTSASPAWHSPLPGAL